MQAGNGGTNNAAKGETRLRVELFEWIEAIVTAFVSVIILLVFVFRVAGVEGSSMEPTLKSGDRIIVSGLFFKPSAGDIVVVTKPNADNKILIKRVIATGGQTVDLSEDGEALYVDGIKLDEPYLSCPAGEEHDLDLPATVPKGHVFVMGDNRYASRDSRYADIGMIDERYLLGRCVFRVLPTDRLGPVK